MALEVKIPASTEAIAAERVVRRRRIGLGVGFLALAALGVFGIVAGALATNALFAALGVFIVVFFGGGALALSILPLAGSFDAPSIRTANKDGHSIVTFAVSTVYWWTIKAALHLGIIAFGIYTVGAAGLVDLAIAPSRTGPLGVTIGVLVTLWLLVATILWDTGRIMRPKISLDYKSFRVHGFLNTCIIDTQDITAIKIFDGRIAITPRSPDSVRVTNTNGKPKGPFRGVVLTIDPIAYPYLLDTIVAGITYATLPSTRISSHSRRDML